MPSNLDIREGVNEIIDLIPTISGGGGSDASAANQVIGNNSLANIDNKTPALVSGNVPVTLPSAQIAALTPPTSLTSIDSITNPLPSGTNTIGKIEIDQSIDGFSNRVNIGDNIDALLTYIKQLVYILGNSIGNVDQLNRLKIRAELVDAVTTVTTVSTVTNITNFAGMPQAEYGANTSFNTFANAVRPNLTF